MLRRASLSLLAITVALPAPALAQPPAVTKPAPPDITRILPANTATVLLINTQADLWADLNRFNPYREQLSYLPANQLPLALFSPTITLSDVQPWLGDRIAFALLPSIAEKETFDAATVVLAAVKDPEALTGFLTKLKETRGTPDTETTYKGVPLIVWQGTPASTPTPTPDSEPSVEPSPLPVPQTSPTPQSDPAPNPAPADEDLPKSVPAPQPVPSPKASPTVTGSYPLPAIAQTLQPQMLTAIDSQLSAKPSLNPTPKPNLPDQLPAPTPLPGEPVAKKPGLAIALLPGHLVIATEAQALERLVDAAANDPARLADNPLFQRTRNHPQYGKSLFVAYGNVSETLRLLSRIDTAQLSTPFPLQLPPLEESQIAQITKNYNAVDSFVWVQPEGIRSQTNTYYTKPLPEFASQPTPDANQILSRLPATTFLSANSRDFKRQWKQFLTAIQEDVEAQKTVTDLQTNFRSTTGIDLEQEIVSWLDGEYTFFLFPTKGGLFNFALPDLNLGMGMILQTSDRPAAEAVLKKLDAYVKSSSNNSMQIVNRRFKGQSFTSWEGRDRDRIVSVFAHGWLDDNTLLLTTGTGTLPQLAPKPYLPLSPTYTFQTAIQGLPTPNEGYFYVNMGASLSFIYSLAMPFVPSEYAPIAREVRRVLGTVRSISTTNSNRVDAQSLDSLWVLGEQPTQLKPSSSSNTTESKKLSD